MIRYAVIILYALGLIRVEAVLHVNIEEISIKYWNPEYFDAEKSDIYVVEGSTDQNTITTNVTVLKKLPQDSSGHFKLLGLSMGQYILPTGLDMTMQFCEMFEESSLIGPYLSVFKTCPPEAGSYCREGYAVPLDNLPDIFPENKYLAVSELILEGKLGWVMNVYFDVQLY